MKIHRYKMVYLTSFVCKWKELPVFGFGDCLRFIKKCPFLKWCKIYTNIENDASTLTENSPGVDPKCSSCAKFRTKIDEILF